MGLTFQGVATISEGVVALGAKMRQKRKDANAISEKQTEVGDRLYKGSGRRVEEDGRVE